MYVILILGSTLASFLGIAQIAFLDTAWLGIVGAIVALVLGIVTTTASRFNHQKRYLNARLAAECLRSEYFLFLGRFDPYADEQDRLQKLRVRVAEITVKGEAL